MGVEKLSIDFKQRLPAFLKEHGRTLLGLFLLAMVVHDIFGAHGFIAMRRTQNEIQRVRRDIDRLNSENAELGDQVKALKSDRHLIEKIAREELQQARKGEIIIRIPQSQQPPADSAAKP